MSFRPISRSIVADFVIAFQNLSERSAVLRKCLSTRSSDLNVGLRLIADKRFCDCDVASIFQLMQVRTQVAIGKFKSIFNAGCYSMDVNWPGGAWHIVFAAGN